MRKSFLIVVAAVLVIAAAAAAWYLLHRFSPREVVPGVYRAGQPSARDLRNAVRELRISTVLNLRGPNPDERWYREEKAEAERLGIRHIDFRMQSFDWPPRPEVVAFTTALVESPKPLLFHCESGVDRSGWASAVARILRGDAPAEAVGELDRSAGHVCNRGECGLHRFFDEYTAWLQRTGTRHSGDVFRRWILDEYYPPPYRAGIRIDSAIPERIARGGEIAMRVTVTNLSHVAWPMRRDAPPGIRLGARIAGPFEGPVDALPIFRKPNGPARDIGRAAADDMELPPGASRELEMVLRAPEAPGRYVIHVDMVDEGVHWFSDVGSSGVLLPVVVE